MEVIRLAIPEIRLVRPKRFEDDRGVFWEGYSRQRYADHGMAMAFVQDNFSLSRAVGTVRGLHFQKPPRAQDKLICVLKGRILDVAVDLRRHGPTYGRYVARELNDRDGEQLLIPIGFAHGFCTLEPDTLVGYKVSDFYSSEHDAGIHWNDPDVGIDWPLTGPPIVSGKDKTLPLFKDIGFLF